MNGGAIYVRSELEAWQCGDEVRPMLATEPETEALGVVLGDYCDVFGLDLAEVLSVPFTRIGPAGCRPYGRALHVPMRRQRSPERPFGALTYKRRPVTRH